MLNHVRHVYEFVRFWPLAEEVPDITLDLVQRNGAVRPFPDVRFVSNTEVGTRNV
jgi:hypothetical protein